MSPEPTIRRMTGGEFDVAVGWAYEEGWNPGLNDAACFYHTDPGGFFAAIQGGEVVGTVSCVIYDDRFAFGGFFMVRKDLRNKGIGHLLALKAIERSGERTLGMDAVVEQQRNYREMGFVIDHASLRYGGAATDPGPRDSRLIPATELDFDDLAAYDRAHFPSSRERFLRRWISQDRAASLALVEDGQISGYGCLRACREGFKYGPLFADSPAIAESLFDGLAATVENSTVFLDVPSPNDSAVELARRRGLRPVFETGRMYRGEPPVLPLHEIYGITSFELG